MAIYVISLYKLYMKEGDIMDVKLTIHY